MNITVKALQIISLVCLILPSFAQPSPKTENDYYRIITIPFPENIEMEVGGMAVLPNGELGVSTRRGDVWIIGNPYLKGNRQPTFKRFASGLHEPLGLLYRGDHYLVAQRGEVTKLTDLDNDGIADEYDSFAKWPLSGNYHQYSYGPVLMPNGDMLVALNVDWIGKGGSLTKWRGWMLKLDKNGKLTPWAAGLRSPSGFGTFQGDIFYTENQGDWVASGRMTHLEKGDFAGNAASLRWSEEPDSPVKLKLGDIPNTGQPMYEVAKKVPGLKPPAVWFPHTILGISTSGFQEDTTKGTFGPFAGQLFVADQGHSKIMRVFMEKINGVWQGVCFPFREGFQSGILKLDWGLDGTLFVGQTSRGWSATGKSPFGIQRLVWTGETPFEMKTIKSRADGFEITFTQPIDPQSLLNKGDITLNSFTYPYHEKYGGDIMNLMDIDLNGIRISEDSLTLSIVVPADKLRKGYIHEIKSTAIRSKEGQPLLHNVGYYTLNEIQTGSSSNDKLIHLKEKIASHDHHQTSSAIQDQKSNKNQNQLPPSWNGKVDETLVLGTLPGLKFDKNELSVKAGSKVSLVFSNNDDMLHNVVFTLPNAGDKVGEAALALGLKGGDQSYVPHLEEVLFHSKIIQPNESEKIFFVAPSKPGNYPFVCTFPGHHLFMKGILKVTN